MLAANALWYPLRYPGEYQSGGKPSTINKVIHYHYPKPEVPPAKGSPSRRGAARA